MVKGRPPKKHGEKSMWARNDEAPFVARLREEALRSKMKLGLDDCFHSWVSLQLIVYVPISELESIGDLDNFITGVCDSLQAADPKVLPYLHKIFRESEVDELDPRYALIIDSDAKVMSVSAEKIALNEGKEVYYKVAVEQIQIKSV